MVSITFWNIVEICSAAIVANLRSKSTQQIKSKKIYCLVFKPASGTLCIESQKTSHKAETENNESNRNYSGWFLGFFSQHTGISYNKGPKGWCPKGARCFVLARKRLAGFWAMRYAFWIYDVPRFWILEWGK